MAKLERKTSKDHGSKRSVPAAKSTAVIEAPVADAAKSPALVEKRAPGSSQHDRGDKKGKKK